MQKVNRFIPCVQVVSFTVNERELACYDYKGAGTYFLEKGDYYFIVGKDAHDAVNNVIKYKGENGGGNYVTEAKGNSGSGNVGLVYKHSVAKDDYEIYSLTDKALKNGVTATATKIENQFEKVDIRACEGATKDFRYVTRSDWNNTVKLGFDENGNCTQNQVKVTVTDEMYRDRKEAMADPVPDGIPFDRYDVNGSNSPDSPGHLKLIDLRAYADEDNDPTNNKRIEYNNPLWDKLLDQLTWEETTNLLSEGWRLTRPIASIAKPNTIDFNGSVGLVCNYSVSESANSGLAVTTNDPDRKKNIGYYVCNGVCASTFNKPLMEEYGEQWGEDGLWSGSNGLYGMGVNLHRSPYGGRNFEYYSEDPHLMGVIANMTALGVKWSGQQGFVGSVLRAEFGMTGIAVSDYAPRNVDGNYLKGILAGSDLIDGTINDLFDNVNPNDYGELAECMRESVKRILYTTVHSNAMNGMTSNTIVLVITPWWQTAITALQVIFTIGFALSLLGTGLLIAWDVADKLKGRKQTVNGAEPEPKDGEGGEI